MNFEGNSETPLDPSMIDPALRSDPLQPIPDVLADLTHGPQAMASLSNLSSLGDLSGLDNEPTWVSKVLTDPRIDTVLQTGTDLMNQSSDLLSQTVESSKLLGQAATAKFSESIRHWLDAAAESWNDPNNAIHAELNYQSATFMQGLKELAINVHDSEWMAKVKQHLGELSNSVTKMGGALGSVDYESAIPEDIALDAAAIRLKENLIDLRENPAFIETFQAAFGDDVSATEATAVLDEMIAGRGKPEVKVVAAGELQGQGAFGDNTIFVSDQLLAASRLETVDAVLMEEIGHYFDQTLNPIDSPGDEGEIFTRLAQGETLTYTELSHLKQEDDHATMIGADGVVISVEQSSRSTYEVQAGDTLWAIAQQHLGDGQRWTELQKEDGSAFTEAEATQLQVGQLLYIPASESAAPQAFQPYTLVSGDTLWEIAQRELGDGSRWTELQKEDGTGFTEAEAISLQPGQVIHIPGASDGSASAAPTTSESTSPAPVAPSGDIELGTYTPNVTQAFLDKVAEISGRLGVVPEYLMAVMGFETGGDYSPDIRNNNSGATGLIQFLESTAVGLGTTTEQLANMSAVEQLDYVEKYLQPYSGRLNSLEDTYMAVLWPKGIGQAPDQAIMTNGDRYYDGNSGLDLNEDGAITPREAADKVREYLPSADLLGIANNSDGGAAPDTSSSGSLSPVWDDVSQERIQSLHPTIQDEATRFINRVEAELGIQLRVTDAFRTFAQQDQLYQQGRNGNAGAIITKAEGGESYHNYGLAIDVVAIVNGSANYDGDYWQQIAEIGKSEGFEWGGDFPNFKDQPHFQFSYGLGVGELEARYEQQRAAGDITDPNEIQGLGGGQSVAVPDSPTSSPAVGGYPGYAFDYEPGQSLSYDANVERWQQRMWDLGWDIAVDGEYGPQSRGVTLAFQQQYSQLEDDGIVGPATWEATFSADAKGPNASSTAEPNSATDNTSSTQRIKELRQERIDLNREIEILGTTSPSVTNALQNELSTVEDTLVAELEKRIPELEQSIESLGTAGGYATLAMQEELDNIRAELDGLSEEQPVVLPDSTASRYPGYAFDYEPGQSLSYDANVERWPQRMRDLGWDIAVDGEYGPQSRGVALAFQQQYSQLEDDGIIGPATWEATFNPNAKGPNAPSIADPNSATDNTSSDQRISELRQQQADLNRDIEVLGTTSPSVTNALQNELNTVENELAEELKKRVLELETSIDSLGTGGGYVTLAMQKELRNVKAELDVLESDTSSTVPKEELPTIENEARKEQLQDEIKSLEGTIKAMGSESYVTQALNEDLKRLQEELRNIEAALNEEANRKAAALPLPEKIEYFNLTSDAGAGLGIPEMGALGIFGQAGNSLRVETLSDGTQEVSIGFLRGVGPFVGAGGGVNVDAGTTEVGAFAGAEAKGLIFIENGASYKLLPDMTVKDFIQRNLVGSLDPADRLPNIPSIDFNSTPWGPQRTPEFDPSLLPDPPDRTGTSLTIGTERIGEAGGVMGLVGAEFLGPLENLFGQAAGIEGSLRTDYTISDHENTNLQGHKLSVSGDISGAVTFMNMAKDEDGNSLIGLDLEGKAQADISFEVVANTQTNELEEVRMTAGSGTNDSYSTWGWSWDLSDPSTRQAWQDFLSLRGTFSNLMSHTVGENNAKYNYEATD